MITIHHGNSFAQIVSSTNSKLIEVSYDHTFTRVFQTNLRLLGFDFETASKIHIVDFSSVLFDVENVRLFEEITAFLCQLINEETLVADLENCWPANCDEAHDEFRLVGSEFFMQLHNRAPEMLRKEVFTDAILKNPIGIDILWLLVAASNVVIIQVCKIHYGADDKEIGCVGQGRVGMKNRKGVLVEKMCLWNSMMLKRMEKEKVEKRMMEKEIRRSYKVKDAIDGF